MSSKLEYLESLYTNGFKKTHEGFNRIGNYLSKNKTTSLSLTISLSAFLSCYILDFGKARYVALLIPAMFTIGLNWIIFLSYMDDQRSEYIEDGFKVTKFGIATMFWSSLIWGLNHQIKKISIIYKY